MNQISSALKISLFYFFFGLLWIYFSDNAINFLVQDLHTLQFLQTIKGWLFISFSSLLLYLLSKKLFNQIETKQNDLIKSNDVLEKVIENAPLIIFWKSNKGVYLGCNSQFLKLINLDSKEKLIGKKDSDFHILEKDTFMKDDLSIMSKKEPKLNYIETITVENKEIKVLNTSKVPLIDEKNNVIGILGVSEDITEQINNQNKLKTQEELLIQQSKLAAMGEMLANIAHQWRQPLSVISTLSTGMKLQKELNISNEEDEKKALDSINENVQYLSKTIDDFKNFFKKDNTVITTDFEKLFNKTIKLIESRLKNRNITIIQNNKNFEFETFESELIQVFINIINNSIDAFEDVKTDKYLFVDVVKNEKQIEIIIKDNAGGISSNIINRIFEPYFTTKGQKQGTGIGLYMCNEIITKRLHGKISAKTEEFKYQNNTYLGATFTIVLPIDLEIEEDD